MEKAEGQETGSAQDVKLVTVLWPKQVTEAKFRVSVGEGSQYLAPEGLCPKAARPKVNSYIFSS